MTRLSFLTRPDLDDEQAAVWDGLVESRATELAGPDGNLIGPFNAFVHAPKIGRRLSSLGALLRFRTSIERRLSEVAICTVGAHWRAEFEFFAHAPMAIEHGVSPDVIDAMRDGRTPTFERDDERVVYDVVTTSGAGCGITKTALENIIDRKFEGTGSGIGTMHKDLTISLDMAEELGVPLFTAATAMQIFHQGKTKYPQGDNWICTRIIEDIVGAELHR